jgi:transcriptional regulator with XRE-family HTH domain
MKPRKARTKVSPTLTDAEIELILSEIGAIVRGLMNKTTLERFAYETGIARSQVDKYRKGGDMLLSTFLRLIHGLGVTPEKFFRKVRMKNE